MKLYKRGNSPYYWADVTVGGVRQRFSTKRTTKSEARAVVENHARRELDREQLGVRETVTLADALDRHLLEIEHELSDLRNVKSRAEKLLGEGAYAGRWSFKRDRVLDTLTSADLAALKTARLREGNAPGTINRELALLQRIVTKAKEDWGVAYPQDLKWPYTKVHHKLRYLSLEEERALLDELDPWRVIPYQPSFEDRSPDLQRALVDQYDLAVALLDTGGRYSEVAELTWDRIDVFHWQWINLYRHKVGNEGRLALTDRLREVLQRRRRETNSPYVFPSRSDPRKPRGHATRGIMRAVDRAGLNADHKVRSLGSVTVHTLRDTFASRLVQAGVSLYKVSRLLGHADIKMTEKYAHLAEEQYIDEAASVLNAIHKGGSISLPSSRKNGTPSDEKPHTDGTDSDSLTLTEEASETKKSSVSEGYVGSGGEIRTRDTRIMISRREE